MASTAGATYGPSTLASIIKWHGRAPAGTNVEPTVTAADEVHEAIRHLELQQSGQLPAEVLRMEYGSDLPREECMQRLRLSSVRYCQHLRTGRIAIASWLRIPFDERVADENQLSTLCYAGGVD